MNKRLVVMILLSLLFYTPHAKTTSLMEFQDGKQSGLKPEERKAQEESEKQEDKKASEARDPREAAYLDAKLTLEKSISGYTLNSSKLTQPMKKILDEKATILKERSDMVVILVGNTCGIGSEEVNQRIGLERANNARDYLISCGVDPSKLKVKSQGKEAPIAKDSTEAERRQNRRVTFEVN